MVTAGEINPTIKLFPTGKAPILIDMIAQGGGRRGAALSGFLFGLGRFEDIVIEAGSGTSAGKMALAVQAHGQALEKLDPNHGRQDTRLLQADLYRTVTEYSPYNFATSLAERTQESMALGKRIIQAAPFAALKPSAFVEDIGRLGQNIGDQFMAYGKAMTRVASIAGLNGLNFFEKMHPLVAVLQDVVGNTRAITSPHAPLLVGNVIRLADERELLLHNRSPMTLKHIAASGALTAYLPTVYVPGIGECRDGAEGGANPPLLDFYKLKKELMPDGKAKIAILYNLSDPDGSLKEELKARDPKLHGHFVNAMQRQKAERDELLARGHDLRIVQAALTPAQRAESLSDTDPDKMRAMFKIGQQQGEDMGFRLLSEALGQDARTLARRAEPLQYRAAKPQLAHH